MSWTLSPAKSHVEAPPLDGTAWLYWEIQPLTLTLTFNEVTGLQSGVRAGPHPAWRMSFQEKEPRHRPHEGRPGEDAVRRRPATSQGERSQEKLNLQIPSCRVLKISFCCLSHQSVVFLLWHPANRGDFWFIDLNFQPCTWNFFKPTRIVWTVGLWAFLFSFSHWSVFIPSLLKKLPWWLRR